MTIKTNNSNIDICKCGHPRSSHSGLAGSAGCMDCPAGRPKPEDGAEPGKPGACGWFTWSHFSSAPARKGEKGGRS